MNLPNGFAGYAQPTNHSTFTSVNKPVPTPGVSLSQKTKYVYSLRSWLVILVAGLLFFMSMSSLTWGLTSLINHDINGVWYITGGALLQGGAILSVWVVEKEALTRPSHS